MNNQCFLAFQVKSYEHSVLRFFKWNRMNTRRPSICDLLRQKSQSIDKLRKNQSNFFSAILKRLTFMLYFWFDFFPISFLSQIVILKNVFTNSWVSIDRANAHAIAFKLYSNLKCEEQYNVCIYSFWTQSLENKEKNNQVEPVLPVIINLSFEKYTN